MQNIMWGIKETCNIFYIQMNRWLNGVHQIFKRRFFLISQNGAENGKDIWLGQVGTSGYRLKG